MDTISRVSGFSSKKSTLLIRWKAPGISMKVQSTANAVWPITRRLGSSLAPYRTPTFTAKIYLPFSIHVETHSGVYDYRASEIGQNIKPTLDNADVSSTAVLGLFP